MKTKKTKAKKKVKIDLRLPQDTLDFYREVAKIADVTLAQAVLVVVGIDLVKSRREKRVVSK